MQDGDCGGEQHNRSVTRRAGRSRSRSRSVRYGAGMRWWPPSLRFDDDPVAVLLPEPLSGEVRALAAEDFVGAVALVRRRTGLNLAPAVRAVEALRT